LRGRTHKTKPRQVCTLILFSVKGIPLSIYPSIHPSPWGRVLLEKLTVTQLVKKLVFYGTQRFMTEFIRAGKGIPIRKRTV